MFKLWGIKKISTSSTRTVEKITMNQGVYRGSDDEGGLPESADEEEEIMAHRRHHQGRMNSGVPGRSPNFTHSGYVPGQESQGLPNAKLEGMF